MVKGYRFPIIDTYSRRNLFFFLGKCTELQSFFSLKTLSVAKHKSRVSALHLFLLDVNVLN